MRKKSHYIHAYYVGVSYNDVVRARRRSRALRQTMLVLLCLMGTSGIIAFGKFENGAIDDGDKVSAQSQPAAKVMKTAVALEQDISTMSSIIEEVILTNQQMQVGVSVADIQTGKIYNYGVQEGFHGASTAKLITASLFLHRVEQGMYSMGTSVGGQRADVQLKKLIEDSDNAAWDGFLKLMRARNVQKWATDNGLKTYDHNKNILAPKDMALYLQKLYNGKLHNQMYTNLLLEHMKNANRTDLIRSSVPVDTNVYHKAGWLEDRLHDAAIIDNGQTAYALVIFTKSNGTYNVQEGRILYDQITLATLNTFKQ